MQIAQKCAFMMHWVCFSVLLKKCSYLLLLHKLPCAQNVKQSLQVTLLLFTLPKLGPQLVGNYGLNQHQLVMKDCEKNYLPNDKECCATMLHMNLCA